MSTRTERCPTCKGSGLIKVSDWIIKGKTEEKLAREKKEAIADIVEVVRCKYCKHWGGVTYGQMCRKYSGAETKVCT
jgi:uncharacterized protein with PIN domain